MGGVGLYGYSGEQGLSVCEGFHRGCVDYLSRQFVPKWDSPNDENVLVTAGTTCLFLELMSVVA